VVVIDDGEYRVVVPTGWDGVSELPLVVHFFGAGGSASGPMSDRGIVDGFDDLGVLFVVPEAIDGFWRTNSAWMEPGDRDDLLFIDDVVADVRQRWPVADDRIYATGFSAGGAMAARLGCDRGDVFSAVAPISGGFWDPAPAVCEGGPVPVSHTHGELDGTWLIEGRCFYEAEDGTCLAGQAPMADNLATWRRHLECDDEAVVTMDGPLLCEVWSSCASGEVRMCMHDGGHGLRSGWPARQFGWLDD
jgi:polyhydroxybutyrate depolymerase